MSSRKTFLPATTLFATLAGCLLTGTAMAAEPTGKAVYDKWCSHCHGPESLEHPGTVALKAKYQGNLPADLLERRDLTEEMISFYVRNGTSIMPFFRKTEISDEGLEGLARYIVGEAGD